MEAQRARREPRRFSAPVPKLEGDIHVFLKRIGQFIASEEVEDEDVFTVLSQAAPADMKEDLWAARGYFRGRPWQEIRDKYRRMLEPGKTRLHYMQDLGAISPRPGESMAEYHERYNDIRDHAYGPGAYDAEYDLETFTKTLPGPWQDKAQDFIAILGVQMGDDTPSAVDLQLMLEQSVRGGPDKLAYSQTARRAVRDSSTGRGRIRCFECGRFGHRKSECPQLRQTSSAKPERRSWSAKKDKAVTCFSCGQIGHYASECPNKGSSRGPRRGLAESQITQRNEIKSLRRVGYESQEATVEQELQAEPRSLLSMQLQEAPKTFDEKKRSEEDAVFPPVTRRETVLVTIAGQEHEGMVDTGADNSFISKDVLNAMPKDTFVRSRNRGRFALANGTVQSCEIITATVSRDGMEIRTQLGVLQKSTFGVLVGMDLIHALGIRWGEKTAKEMSRALDSVKTVDLDTVLENMDVEDRQGVLHHEDRARLMQKIEAELEENKETERHHSTLEPIPIEFKDPQGRVEGCWVKQHRMEPHFQRLYEEQVRKWEEQGIIEEHIDHDRDRPSRGSADGQFNVRTIPTISNKLRFVQNFKDLNKMLKKDTNDVPVIDDALLLLAEQRPTIFSKIDLRQAYLQIPLRESDREVTAFTCRGKRYRFITAPLGLQHIPSAFQRRIRGLLQKAGLANEVHSHLDDLVIAHKDPDKHAEIVRRTLEALNNVRLTINIDKSTFFATRLIILGMVVEADGIRPNLKKVCNIMDWKRPTSKRAVQSFIGKVGFFRRFLPEAAKLLKPFYDKQKEGRFEWTEELESHYRAIAGALLSSEAFLKFPEPGVELTLDVDASKDGIGGVLHQTVNGETRIIGFNSRTLRGSELNYTIPKKELLSAVFHVEYWKHWLTGREFHLRMDNKGIQMLLDLGNRQHHDGIATSWATKLQMYSFRVSHIEGEKNQMADAASRLYAISTREWPDEEVQRLIKEAHELGHYGARAMHFHITVVRGATGIPRLMERCEEWTKECPTCRQVDGHRVAYAPLEKPKRRLPNERWHADLLEMETSATGNRYISVIVDELTRYCWLRALPNKSAEEVSGHMMEIMTSSGFPAYIKSDEGAEYANELQRRLEAAAGIKHQFVMAYNHHANGLVERLNRTIRETLLRNTLGNGSSTRDWDTHVPITQLHVNMKFHRSLRASPFTLMHGRNAFALAGGKLDKSIWNDGAGEEASKQTEKLRNFWETFNGAVIPHLHEIAEEEHEKRRGQYRKKTTRFKVGETVMYRDPRVTKKSVPKNKGPFNIVKLQDKGRKILLKGRDGEFFSPTNFLHRTGPVHREELGSVHGAEDNDPDQGQGEQGQDDLRDRSYEDPRPSGDAESGETPRRSRRRGRTAFRVGTGERTRLFPAPPRGGSVGI